MKIENFNFFKFSIDQLTLHLYDMWFLHITRCIDGYFGFPNCSECGCGAGKASLNCDVISGQCLCRPGYTGLKCNDCENGYFSKVVASGESKQLKMCTLCACNQQGTTEEICSKDQGVCFCKPNFAGDKCDRCAPGFFGPQCERKFVGH
jgi:hypothetical protein